MGHSAAPRTFTPATPFGQTPQAPIATETQPLATVTGPGTPAYSGYNMTPGTPQPAAGPSPVSGLGDMQDRLQAFRGNRQVPFYGQMF